MIARTIAIAVLCAVAFPATARAQFTYDHRAWLGIIMAGADEGVRVDEVLPGTPAERSGLEVGDVITSIAGTPTRDTRGLQTTIMEHRVGDEVDIAVRRGKRALTLSATLVAKPDPGVIRRERLIDRPAPAFSLDVLSGDGSGTLADHRGKVVVVVSWTMACSGCLRVFGELGRLQTQLGDKLVVIVAAAAPTFDVRKALEARPLPFTVASDAMGAVRGKYDIMANQYDPVIALVDAQGYVRDVAFSAVRVARIAQVARALAGEKAPQ